MKRFLPLFVLFFALLLAAGTGDIDARISQEVEQGAKVRILNYHMVNDMDHSLAVAPKDFDRQMAWSRGGSKKPRIRRVWCSPSIRLPPTRPAWAAMWR